MRDGLHALLGLVWLLLGAYHLLAATGLASRPRRGTALRLSRRGYRLLGVGFLALAAFQILLIAAE